MESEKKRYFPGTTIATDLVNRRRINEVLDHIFAGGDIYRSQVIALTGIEPYSIQNWIARGFVSHSENKQYSKRQLCRFIIINMLSETLQIGEITDMLSSVNGDLSDEGDDLIPDDVLYGCFAELCAMNEGALKPAKIVADAAYITEDLTFLRREDRETVAEVLETMFYAYRSAEMSRIAHDLLEKIKDKIKGKGEQ